ncbi:hypothetical protein Micbo1qcDRAFT_205358 [Microdochium bolleyi]|uniref:NmrA-like domain-containing protein n=1 Tax=Microdochium bolleyi TaxID=196109 RepID=A0A136J0G9_9PEZI|nr:hypothetical protein Micbo1qcDRAFT_205358 [Microdochium bolleyi]
MPKIFITTATGAIGSALCRTLLSSNPGPDQAWSVHATTRNLSSPVAVELAGLGVHFTQADWDAPASVFESAMQGCTHLFLNLLPNIKTMSSELPWAEKILGIASKAGVKHVVYSSAYMGSAGDEAHDTVEEQTTATPLPAKSELAEDTAPAAAAPDAQQPGVLPAGFDLAFLASRISVWKGSVEQAILKHDPPFETATILQPAWFTLNLLAPRVNMMFPSLPTTRAMTSAFLPTTKVPLVDTRDIAQFAALALRDPAAWNGRTLPVWNEFLTMEELLGQLGEAVAAAETGEAQKEPFRAEFLTEEQIAERKPVDLFVNIQLFMRDMSRDAAALTEGGPVESYGIKQSTFREFLEREKELVKATYCKA